MTGQVVGWAFRQKTGSVVTKALLVKLADNANDTGYCFPSIQYLVAHLELSERAVREHIRILEGLGLLRIIRRSQNGLTVASHFQLNITGKFAEVTVPPRKPPMRDVPGGMQETPLRPAPTAFTAMHDVPTETPSNKPHEKPVSAKAEKPSDPKPERTKRTRIGDWRPGDHERALAIAYWEARGRRDLSAAVEDKIEAFVAHHKAHGKAMADWPAAWQTWYGNALRDRPSAGFTPISNGAAPAPASTELWVQRLEFFHHGKPEDNVEPAYPKGFWRDNWGPKPGESGCLCPPEAQRQYGARHSPRLAG